MEKLVLGVDLGGTKINTGIVKENGEIVNNIKIPTLVEEGPDAVIGRIIKSIKDVLKKSQIDISNIEGIGIGSPGPINSKTGVVMNPSNLPGWNNIHITDKIYNEFKLPVRLENDANAAGFGEYVFGSGKGKNPFVYITVSTGIGGGVVIDGKILDGINSNGAEIGHHMINFNGPKCGCGSRGCFEAYASGTAIARFAKEAIESGEKSLISTISNGGKIKAEHVFAAAKQNDKLALKVIENEKYYLGIGLTNVIAMFNPERIAIGGGVSHEWDMLKDGAIKVINERGLKPSVDACDIVKAELGDEIGVLGAAALAFRK